MIHIVSHFFVTVNALMFLFVFLINVILIIKIAKKTSVNKQKK